MLRRKTKLPPEDIGGVWGYQDFLKNISDLKPASFGSMLQRIGGTFDPEYF